MKVSFPSHVEECHGSQRPVDVSDDNNEPID